MALENENAEVRYKISQENHENLITKYENSLSEIKKYYDLNISELNGKYITSVSKLYESETMVEESKKLIINKDDIIKILESDLSKIQESEKLNKCDIERVKTTRR